MKLFCVALLVASFAAGCGTGNPREETTETKSVILNGINGKWPNPRHVPVCLINRGDISDHLYNDVFPFVKQEYARQAGIGLVGFEACKNEDFNPKNPSIRIYFDLVRNWHSDDGVLSAGGVSLIGWNSGDCGERCKGGTMRLEIDRDYRQDWAAFITDTTRATVLHEFGHALGLHHEHARTDSNCWKNESIPEGGEFGYVGGYDSNSIMNYCYRGAPALSNGDVEGLKRLYPQTADFRDSMAVRVQASGKCLDVEGYSFDPGTKIVQWDCHGQRNQLWRLKDVGDGKFEIRSASTDLCMDVAYFSKDNGAKVLQWPCTGSDNQRVRILDRGDGKKSFQFAHSGRCLDVAGGRPDNGIQLQQWDCYGNSAQTFY